MYKNLRWKFLTILAVLVVSGGFGLYPIIASSLGVTSPAWLMSYQLKLGLDLRGGLQQILKVQTEKALLLEIETSAEQLRAALTEAKITPAVIRAVAGKTEFVVEGVPPVNDQQFRTVADNQFGLTFTRDQTGPGNYTFRMRPNIIITRRDETVAQAVQTLERRVNELGVSEPWVGPYGTAGDEIIVQLPGLKDPERAKAIMGQTARLDLKLVEEGPFSDQQALLQPHGGKIPEGMMVVSGVASREDPSVVHYLVRRVPIITGSELRSARQSTDEFGQPAVSFTLNSDGAVKFGAATAANIGRLLAIVLDDRVMSAPSINGVINREGQIYGSFTIQEAQDLALVLRSGALPAELTYLATTEVGPTLGADSIRSGVMASIMGLTFVTLFMLAYYRLAGINAFVSIAMNLIILVGFMAYLGAVMTLPGIAGFILTIGMGVDSNVLIFERIREELQGKKGVRQALAAGFDRVFITIIDTHVASLIAAAFLFQFGTGPIRGFATTLFFGLLSNVFTAVFVSRTLFEFVLSKKPAGATQLSI
jgi:preprotein translocase subunit SecD